MGRSPNEWYEGRERQEYRTSDGSPERLGRVSSSKPPPEVDRASQASKSLETSSIESASEAEAERFDPRRDGPELAYEHLHRYVLASQVVEGLRVLDLAAGTGYGSNLLARTAGKLVSLDLERAGLSGGPAGVCGDAQKLPFADGSFDVVVCFEAIEHVPDPARLVAEAKRVLSGPSILLVSTPDREIYSVRAEHRNPYHIAEMTRPEFQRLLRTHFGHLRMLGQGLWAGSWIAGLAPGKSARGLGKRNVSALPIPDSGSVAGSRARGPRWADPSAEELPTPVYLLAACADSKEGRLLLGRTIPQESILHDSSQWLLGQYDRLALAWGDELARFEEELARARRGHEDQSAQIEAASETIGKLETQIDRARRASDARERELGEARVHADDQASQLSRARASTASLEAELETARLRFQEQVAVMDSHRAGVANLESEVAHAREANQDLERQVSEARSAHERLESELLAAGVANADLEAQVDGSRSAIAEGQAELGAARSTIDGMQGELATARTTIDDRDVQIEAARSTIEEMRTELETARVSIDGKDSELAAARSLIAEKDDEIAVATSVVDGKDRELAVAKSVVDGKDSELRVAREGIDEKAREIEASRIVVEGLQRELAEMTRLAGEREQAVSETRLSIRAAEREVSSLRDAINAAERNVEEAELRSAEGARRIAELERGLGEERRRRIEVEASQRRLFARLGADLSDWLERWKGGRE